MNQIFLIKQNKSNNIIKLILKRKLKKNNLILHYKFTILFVKKYYFNIVIRQIVAGLNNN